MVTFYPHNPRHFRRGYPSRSVTMYLGELCKPGKPCKVRRDWWVWSWDGYSLRDTQGNVVDYLSVGLLGDWELAKPKFTKVIDWPEGTWGFDDEGDPMYRGLADTVVIKTKRGSLMVMKLAGYEGIIDPKAEQEFKK